MPNMKYIITIEDTDDGAADITTSAIIQPGEQHRAATAITRYVRTAVDHLIALDGGQVTRQDGPCLH